MARRKNTRFIDPRYFMDEKMERLDERTYRPKELAGDLVTAVLSDLRFDRDGEAKGGMGYPLSDLLGGNSLPMVRLQQMLKTYANDPDMRDFGTPDMITQQTEREIRDIVKSVQSDGQAEVYTTEGSAYILKRTDDSIPQSESEAEKKRQTGQKHGLGVVMSGRGY